jgi:hypothetical protein
MGRKMPKLWRTFEELSRDHERLCGEVEELKKQFEGHVHGSAGGMVGVSTGGVQHPGGTRLCLDCKEPMGNDPGVIHQGCMPF